jgi:hypothetical protein
MPETLLSRANTLIRESYEYHIMKLVNEMEIKQSAAIAILIPQEINFLRFYSL